MASKKRGNKIGPLSMKISNRLSYTIISVFFLVLISAGVYAVLGSVPNPGHPVSELQACSDGEILKTSGGAWTCAADEGGSGGSSQWTTSGNNIYYNTGNVGIGTSTPTKSLEVSGDLKLGSGDGVTLKYVSGTSCSGGEPVSKKWASRTCTGTFGGGCSITCFTGNKWSADAPSCNYQSWVGIGTTCNPAVCTATTVTAVLCLE